MKISKSSFSVIYGQTDRYKKVLLETTHSLDIEDKDLEKLNKVLDKYSVPQNKRGKYIFSLCSELIGRF